MGLMFLPRTVILVQLEISCLTVTQKEGRGKKRYEVGGAILTPDTHPPAVMSCWPASDLAAGTKALLLR